MHNHFLVALKSCGCSACGDVWCASFNSRLTHHSTYSLITYVEKEQQRGKQHNNDDESSLEEEAAVPPNPLNPNPVNLAAPAVSSSTSEISVIAQLQRTLELMVQRLDATDERVRDVLSGARLTPTFGEEGKKKRRTPTSASTTVSLKSEKKRRRRDSSSGSSGSESGSESSGSESDRSRGRKRRRRKSGGKKRSRERRGRSRALKSPDSVSRRLKRITLPEGVSSESWDKVVAFASSYEKKVRSTFMHIFKFPGQSDVETWWLNRLLLVGGLSHLGPGDQLFSDVREWVQQMTPAILS